MSGLPFTQYKRKAECMYCPQDRPGVIHPVLWAAEKEVTAGTSAHAFSPDKICTRAEIVTFRYRADDQYII